MRLVRIDRIAPGGGALDLHPRMTVLSDAPPELRRRLVEVFRSFSNDAAPGHGGLLEVNGVRLSLDRATLDQLRLDPEVDAVLRLETPAAGADPDSGSGPDDGIGPSSEPTVAPTAAPSGPTDELRRRLREVAARRTELSERMDQHRGDLDPHATTAVEVCLGQLEAMESRRSTIRSEWEDERTRRAERRADLLTRRSSVVEWIERAERLDAPAVRAAAEALVRALEPPTELDPVAIGLADRLEGLLVTARELVARRTTLQLREREASQRLDEAVEATRSAERQMRPGAVDPDVVARLEAVRDEIFSVGDRSGRLGASRNKRRVSELRAEEAVLLEQLGYDTYSAYVMGIPSLRAEMERIGRVDSAQLRSERIEAEVEELRSELPDRSTVERAGAELASTLVESLSYLGDPRAMTLAGTSHVPDDVEDLAELVYSTTEELRHRRVAAVAEDAPQVVAAVDRLRAVLIDNTVDWPGDDGATRPETVPVGAFPRDPSTVPAPELLEAATGWTRWHERVERALGPARARATELGAEVAALDAEGDPNPDMTRWAELEAELDAALDRLSLAEERVRSHEVATAAIAELREQELVVRDEERALLAAIATAEHFTSAVPSDHAPSDQVGADQVGADQPPPYRPETVAPVAGPDPDPAWTVVSRLAAQRSVSFAGAVPLLVDGLPDEPGSAVRVLERLQAMSDLVQVIVLAEADDGSLGAVDPSTAAFATF